MYTVPAELPTGRNYGATMASGHLTQQLEKVRCCVVAEAIRAARVSAGCCKPLVAPGAAPRASEQLALKTACLTAGEADPVQVAIQQARQIGVGNSGSGIGMQVCAPSNTVYLKRKMDMIYDPRIVGPKENQYANVQVPRPLPPCQVPPQRLPNAKEPIPVPQFRCALLNILVSN
jgi:hypothetical protein